jgi:hypothetical protein
MHGRGAVGQTHRNQRGYRQPKAPSGAVSTTVTPARAAGAHAEGWGETARSRLPEKCHSDADRDQSGPRESNRTGAGVKAGARTVTAASIWATQPGAEKLDSAEIYFGRNPTWREAEHTDTGREAGTDLHE